MRGEERGGYPTPETWRADEGFAREADASDPLRALRARFSIPKARDGSEQRYFCGNSLGLLPLDAPRLVEEECRKWGELAVEGHFAPSAPWYTYHELLRDPAARIVGALPHEVVLMNGLTVNLHLMMVSFFRPTRERWKVLMEAPAFPSDTYAVKSHLDTHGLDPADALVVARPRAGESCLRTEDIEAVLETEGDRIALVLLGGVNFFTGQVLAMERLARAARARGCVIGYDLAHAAGNVPLRLHDWDVDFAVWCNYKYLNGGPGTIAGCFVHERHVGRGDLPRFGGWWGNDPGTRFRMQLEEEFVPVASADGWQLSNPPILAMAPLRASLAIFDEIGMEALRRKSESLTGYLRFLLDRLPAGRVGVLTPREPSARGCQLSLVLSGGSRAVRDALEGAGIVCDFREPDVLRVAPTPLYNTFHDVWTLARVLETIA